MWRVANNSLPPIGDLAMRTLGPCPRGEASAQTHEVREPLKVIKSLGLLVGFLVLLQYARHDIIFFSHVATFAETCDNGTCDNDTRFDEPYRRGLVPS